MTTITIERALLEQALVALIGMQFHATANVRKMDPAGEVIEAIRAALAAPTAPKLDPTGSELHSKQADQAELPSQGQVSAPAWHDAPTEVKQIAEALRQIGLTLVRTSDGYKVLKLGAITSQEDKP